MTENFVYNFHFCLPELGWLVFDGTFNTNRLYDAMVIWNASFRHRGQADNINNIRNTLVIQEITSLTC